MSKYLSLPFATLVACTTPSPPNIATSATPVVEAIASPTIAVEPSVDPPVEAPPPVRARDPYTLLDEQSRPIEVYPPIVGAPSSSAPIVVVLHATCMEPASVCDWFGSAGRDVGWLVCPSGNDTCAGEPDWYGTGKTKATFLAHAIARAEESANGFLDATPGVLIGWSRGAYAARDILEASLDDAQLAALSSRFHGLVLLAAQVTPKPAVLRRAGITRVVMAAGDYDGSRPTMEAAVAALKKWGFEARYVSLGKIAHVWPTDFEARMREPIAWAAGNPE